MILLQVLIVLQKWVQIVNVLDHLCHQIYQIHKDQLGFQETFSLANTIQYMIEIMTELVLLEANDLGILIIYIFVLILYVSITYTYQLVDFILVLLMILLILLQQVHFQLLLDKLITIHLFNMFKLHHKQLQLIHMMLLHMKWLLVHIKQLLLHMLFKVHHIKL